MKLVIETVDIVVVVVVSVAVVVSGADIGLQSGATRICAPKHFWHTFRVLQVHSSQNSQNFKSQLARPMSRRQTRQPTTRQRYFSYGVAVQIVFGYR